MEVVSPWPVGQHPPLVHSISLHFYQTLHRYPNTPGRSPHSTLYRKGFFLSLLMPFYLENYISTFSTARMLLKLIFSKRHRDSYIFLFCSICIFYANKLDKKMVDKVLHQPMPFTTGGQTIGKTWKLSSCFLIWYSELFKNACIIFWSLCLSFFALSLWISLKFFSTAQSSN